MVPAQVTGVKCPREMRLLQLLSPGYGLGALPGAQVIEHLGPVLQRLHESLLLIRRHLRTLRMSGWGGKSSTDGLMSHEMVAATEFHMQLLFRNGCDYFQMR